MRKISSVVDLLRQNPRSPIISSVYGLNLERRTLKKNLYEVDSSDMQQTTRRYIQKTELLITTAVRTFNPTYTLSFNVGARDDNVNMVGEPWLTVLCHLLTNLQTSPSVDNETIQRNRLLLVEILNP
jgi:hypothetical protein